MSVIFLGKLFDDFHPRLGERTEFLGRTTRLCGGIALLDERQRALHARSELIVRGGLLGQAHLFATQDFQSIFFASNLAIELRYIALGQVDDEFQIVLKLWKHQIFLLRSRDGFVELTSLDDGGVRPSHVDYVKPLQRLRR